MAAGVKFGRKRKLSDNQRAEAVKRRAAGETLAVIAKSVTHGNPAVAFYCIPHRYLHDFQAAGFFDFDDRLKRLSDLRYARDDAAGQQCEIQNPRACRACIRRAKGSDGAIHQNDWDRPSNDQDRNRQSRLQLKRFIFLRKIAVA